ncbi:hypothetical protein [Limnohabitans sp. Rim8]|uniref:hypothetical protein n=1 Tax=Limnohabitans sp. Rim8 TaxID=1100718 RepID=UPI00330624C1
MNPNTEQLVFKGMRRFRYRRDELLLKDAERSPYFWWWSYLRLSKDYWWVCQRKGVADDPRLREMYRDFGKVYEMTFEQWWDKRGINLFSEQLALPSVRQLNANDLQLSKGVDQHLLLEIPLNLTEKTIISQVRKLISQQPEREVLRTSSAKRKLAKMVGIRQDVIESAYAAWRLYYESRDGRSVDKIGQVTGTKSLYQIGKELRLVRTCMPQPTDDKNRAAKRVNGMKVAVSRMLARSNNLIENAAIGIFPSIQTIKEPIVWRPVQQQRMEEAVTAGQWRPLFNAGDTLNVQQRDDLML